MKQNRPENSSVLRSGMVGERMSDKEKITNKYISWYLRICKCCKKKIKQGTEDRERKNEERVWGKKQVKSEGRAGLCGTHWLM